MNTVEQAVQRGIRHFLAALGEMDEGLPRRFEALRPAIKRRWEELLRRAPNASPLSHPDLMVYLMDEILDRLSEILRRQEAGEQDKTERPAPIPEKWGCALNPLMAYYITGEQAIIESAAPALGGRFNEALDIYHHLAHDDIEAFCGVCCNRHKPACPLDGHHEQTSCGRVVG